ncbi:MAG: hypothetical protein AAGL89_09935 [Pseudomonadota bacterium]
MRLEQILFALEARADARARPDEMAGYAFMQFLGSLDGNRSFADQARAAKARLAVPQHPALICFAELLDRSLADPFEVLPLAMPPQRRRGGRAGRGTRHLTF